MFVLADFAVPVIAILIGVLIYRYLVRSPRFRTLVDDIADPATSDGEEALESLEHAQSYAESAARREEELASRHMKLSQKIVQARKGE